jgi:WD40 repeat protein/tRNA A-37 threonylcarbamoyl transferase component Bud32
MSFLTKLFGKGKKKINLQVTKVDEEKSEPKPEGTGTTLRKPEGPELTALEMANRKDWEVKTLPIWEPGDVILDTYEVEDVISGGMGHVYIAEHKHWKRKLAIKSPNEMMLSDKALFARILREANSWVELGLHPNIAYCYFVRNIEEVPHIFVEYVDGGNLRQWIEDGKCIDYRTNLDLAIQFCHGMEFAHSKGMIHRDIKPENVLMTKEGIVKITDFGLVREQESGNRDQGAERETIPQKTETNLTQVGTIMGTHGYMSPEQIRDSRDVDERSDIYSFGVCLYEMFTGNMPYRENDQNPSDPVALSGDETFPTEIAEVLKKCVQPDRDSRYNIFLEIRDVFSQTYEVLYKEKSQFADLELVDLEADGLNNRGVACFELGRKEDAIEYWEKTLKINQMHPEATYNLSLIQWRDAKIADDEVLRRIDNCGSNPSADKERLAELTANIHAERHDPDAVKDVLQDFPGRYEDIYSGMNMGNITCVRTMEGNSESVSSVSLTRDGRYAVFSGIYDRKVRLWDFETSQCLQTMEGHTWPVTSVSITPDGRYAVSGSGSGINYGDKTIRFWDLETGQCLHTMEGHTYKVTSVSLTPDGRYAVSGSGDETLRLWDLETGQCLRTMEGHTDGVDSVSIAADGRYAVLGSNVVLWLWDLETGQCLRTMEGHTHVITSVAFTPSGRYFLSGSYDRTLRLWDQETGQCLRIMEGHTNKVRSVSLTPDGRYAVSGGDDRTVRLWDLETGQCLRTIEGHTDKVVSVSFTPDGRYAVSGSDDKTLRLWEFETSKSYRSEPMVSLPKGFEQRKIEEEILKEAVHKAEELYKKKDYRQSFSILYETWEDMGFSHNEDIHRLYTGLMKKGRIKGLAFSFQKKILTGHTLWVESVSITQDGRYAVSGSHDKTLRLWDIETGQCLQTMEGHTGGVFSASITPDARYAVSGSNDNVRLWDLETGQCVHNLMYSTGSYSATLIPGGRYAVAGASLSSTASPALWDFETGKCLRILTGHTNRVLSVSLTPDGRYAVSGGKGTTIRLWDFETGQCLHILEGHKEEIFTVAITPDCRYAVSGSDDKTVRLWDLKIGKCLHTMEGHTAGVYSVSITQDGRYAVSAGDEENLRLWDLETGQCIHIMEGHTSSVKSVSLTADGRYAVSGSRDNTVRLWEFIWDLEFD